MHRSKLRNQFWKLETHESHEPYVCRQNYAEAIESLEPTISNISAWFKNNRLVVNPGKSHFLVSLYDKITLKILGCTVEFSPCEELLEITVN